MCIVCVSNYTQTIHKTLHWESKSQRDKESKRQRDKETKRQRDKESKSQRVKETKDERRKDRLFETLMSMNWFINKSLICFGTRNARNVQKLNEWMKDKNRKKPLRLMQTALTSLWCCAGWKFPSKLRIFSLPHHPPVGLHPSQGDKQKKTFPGRNRILSVNSSSAKPQRLSRSKTE